MNTQTGGNKLPRSSEMSNSGRYPPVPGYFFVQSRPNEALSLEEYHNWYETEHGPLRMRLEFFPVGQRYKSRDLDPPLWLAAYDVADLSCFEDSRYTTLRENRSSRESILLDNGLDLMDRRIFKTLSTRGKCDGPAPVIMAVTFVVKKNLATELHDWYEEEHLDDISRIPGWRRSRRFQLVESADQRDGYEELLAVHDFDENNGLGGPEHEEAKSAPWRSRILGIIESRDNTIFDFIHSFDAGDYRKPSRMDVKRLEECLGLSQE